MLRVRVARDQQPPARAPRVRGAELRLCQVRTQRRSDGQGEMNLNGGRMAPTPGCHPVTDLSRAALQHRGAVHAAPAAKDLRPRGNLRDLTAVSFVRWARSPSQFEGENS